MWRVPGLPRVGTIVVSCGSPAPYRSNLPRHAMAGGVWASVSGAGEGSLTVLRFGTSAGDCVRVEGPRTRLPGGTPSHAQPLVRTSRVFWNAALDGPRALEGAAETRHTVRVGARLSAGGRRTLRHTRRTESADSCNAPPVAGWCTPACSRDGDRPARSTAPNRPETGDLWRRLGGRGRKVGQDVENGLHCGR